MISNEQSTKENDFKPAWKDRIGLTDRWRKDLDRCSEAFGTPDYIDCVECLKNDLVNIKDGPQLINFVDDYIDGDLNGYKKGAINYWVDNNPDLATDEDILLGVIKEINLECNKKLHHFIIQLLEDNGFGTYKSGTREDDIGLTD